jgi:small subunit ribosomal protein S4
MAVSDGEQLPSSTQRSMVERVRTTGGIVARYTDPVCRLCRREGMKLFLKGDRCFKDKCAIERRNYAPGQHGRRRSKVLGYGIQLREKQKVKRIYGLLERQFRTYFSRAEKKTGITGENLLRQLELRLDNVVYSLGFAASRAQARQLVRHGHIEVNGKKINIPSYQVRKGDAIQVREKSRKNEQIRQAVETASGRGIPAWLQLNPDQFLGTVMDVPKREDIRLPIQEQLIVELYSK